MAKIKISQIKDLELFINSEGTDGHISGVIKWKTGLTFVSVELYWRKNNVIYYSNGVERTSTAADGTNPRIDLFYGDDTGDWGIIAGTPAGVPSKPLVTDADTQVEISFVTILAGATEPDDFENITAYDEFGTIVGGETDVTLTVLDGSGTINSTEQAYSGTKSIKYTSGALNGNINFTFAASRNMSDLVALSFGVYLETVGDNRFWVRFFNLAGTEQIGLRIVVDNGAYGFDSTLLNTWQNIIIPKSAFNVGDLQYGQLEIYPRLANSTFFLDLVEVQEGNNSTLPSNLFARDVQTDTDNFDNNLSSADDTVQKALDTIDDLSLGDVTGGVSSVDENITVYDGVTGKVIKDSGINISEVIANTLKNPKFIDGTDPADAVYMDGNVGVQNLDPEQSLDVAGNIRIRATNGNEDRFLFEPGLISANGRMTMYNKSEVATIVLSTHPVVASYINAYNFGIKTTDPKSALDVNGGIKIADDTDVASIDKIGTFRHKVVSDVSVVEVCKQTGVASYAWEDINGSDSIGFAFSDETTAFTVATGVISFHMPNYATTLTGVSVNVVTAPTGSVATFDINEGGTSVLSTKITIDAGEFTSETAATPPVISDSAIAANAIITVDINGIGSTVAGAGGKVWLYVKRA